MRSWIADAGTGCAICSIWTAEEARGLATGGMQGGDALTMQR
jgi:hypothetical protein